MGQKPKLTLTQRLGLSVIKSEDMVDSSDTKNETSSLPKREETPSFPKREETPSFPNKPNLFEEDEVNVFGDNSDSTSITEEIVEETKNETNPEISDIEALYKKGFGSMNKDGIDFYEFFENLSNLGNIDKTEFYQMGFNFAKSMNPTITKESLTKDAEEYVQEIEKAYKNMIGKGKQERDTLNSKKIEERTQLQDEISSLEEQIRKTQVALNQKKNELSGIDIKYGKALERNLNRAKAHDIVKNKLVSDIKKVVQNINQTIK